MEITIAEGTTPFTNYVDAQTFRTRTDFHRKLKANPSLLGVHPSVDAFYTAMENGAIGVFYQISEGISQLGQMDATAEQQYEGLENQIAAKMADLSAVDAQLLTAIGTARELLIVERRTLVQAIDSLYSQRQLLDESISVQRVAEAGLLLALNTTAVTASTPEQYLKDLNAIYLNTVAKGDFNLDPTEVSQLSAMANTCPYENGPAILGARVLLEVANGPQEYDDELLRTPPSQYISNNTPSGGNVVETNGLFLYPNPAKDNLEIRFPLIEDGAEILVMPIKS